MPMLFSVFDSIIFVLSANIKKKTLEGNHFDSVEEVLIAFENWFRLKKNRVFYFQGQWLMCVISNDGYIKNNYYAKFQLFVTFPSVKLKTFWEPLVSYSGVMELFFFTTT